MEIKNTTDKIIIYETDFEGTKTWLRCLRKMLLELDNLEDERIKNIFLKYNLYFLEYDEFPRINVNNPE